MSVVTSSFNTTTSTNWASSTWVSTDPSWKVDVQLKAWVTAINDTSIIEVVQDPGSATSRSTTSAVQWMLRARSAGDTATDYGIIFASRYAGTSTQSNSDQTYYARTTPQTANNNYGTYSSTGVSTSNESFGTACNFFTAYEATGTTPWFVYSCEAADKTSRWTRMLLRFDNSALVAGSYYPASGIGKWIYYNQGYIRCPISSITAPYKGFGGSTTQFVLRTPVPAATPIGDGYFFRLSTQYAGPHALGTVTTDLLTSNTTTGVWGDTTVIDNVTYTCLGNTNSSNLWVKTS